MAKKGLGTFHCLQRVIAAASSIFQDKGQPGYLNLINKGAAAAVGPVAAAAAAAAATAAVNFQLLARKRKERGYYKMEVMELATSRQPTNLSSFPNGKYYFMTKL